MKNSRTCFVRNKFVDVPVNNVNLKWFPVERTDRNCYDFNSI